MIERARRTVEAAMPPDLLPSAAVIQLILALWGAATALRLLYP